MLFRNAAIKNLTTASSDDIGLNKELFACCNGILTRGQGGTTVDSDAAIQEIQQLSTYTSIHEIVKKEAVSGFVAHKQTFKLKMSEVDTAD